MSECPGRAYSGRIASIRHTLGLIPDVCLKTLETTSEGLSRRLLLLYGSFLGSSFCLSFLSALFQTSNTSFLTLDWDKLSGEIIVALGIVLVVAIGGILLSNQSNVLGKVVAVVIGNFSATDIATYARNAGFVDTDLTTAVAIALAESSGDPNARGDRTDQNDPSTATSYGLWQIHFTVHRDILASLGLEPSDLFDPQNNANAAFAVWEQQGFNAWSTYGNQPGHNNAYAAHLDEASQAVSA